MRRLAGSLSIRTRLTLMVLSILLPALATCWWALRSAFLGEELAIENSVQDTTRALSLVVEREIDKRAAIATVLADSPFLDGDDGSGAPSIEAQRRFHEQAGRAVRGIDGWVVLSTRDRQVLTTLLPFGQPVPPAPPGLRGRFGFALDAPVLTGMALGRVSQRLVASVQVPVRRGGDVRMNVGVTMLPAEFQRIVDAQKTPAGWTVAVIDSKGVVAARRPNPDMWIGQPATALMAQRLRAGGEGRFEATSLENVPTVAFYSTSPLHGWSFVIAVPRVEYGSVVRRALPELFSAAAVLLLLSVALAFWMGRRIAGPLKVLEAQARGLEAGEVVEARQTGGRECDGVSRALASASVTISRSRFELEAKVAQARHETSRVHDRLAHSQRIEALGRLTGGVAHDFNNLLAVIGNNAEVLRRRTPGDVPRQLDAIARAVGTGSKLTQHLLRFSRKQDVRPERIEWKTCLPGLLELMASALGKGVRLDHSMQAEVRDVVVDPSELELTVLNVTVNARQAMPDGGSVVIGVRNADRANPADAALLGGLPAAEYVLVTISDTGPGIAPGASAHVFEPFFTTKPAGEGTGLGLSQVMGFCTQAGGMAWVLDAPGGGACIALVLPAAPAAVELDPVEPTRSSDRPGTSTDRSDLLLVEDNAELADATGELLAAYGYRVTLAGSADEAMRLLGRPGARPDVVLTDIVMPGSMDGVALARHLEALEPPIPFVVVSGYSTHDLGALGFPVLRKPCSPEAILAALRSALDAQPVA